MTEGKDWEGEPPIGPEPEGEDVLDDDEHLPSDEEEFADPPPGEDPGGEELGDNDEPPESATHADEPDDEAL